MTTHEITFKKLLKVTVIISLWIYISETLRYFFLVMPEMHEFLSPIQGVAVLNLKTFSLWGVWMTLLSGLICWNTFLTSERLGYNFKSLFISGFVSWLFFFFLFWFGMANMALARWEFVPIVSFFCMIETFIASWLAQKLLK